MTDLNIIKLAILTVALQSILVLITFLIYYWKEGINKRNLLHRKKEVNEGMIWDKEIDVESGWILYRQVESRMKVIKETIKENEEQIKEEKKKTPMDVEKVKDLRFKNEMLGYAGRTKEDGSFLYESEYKGSKRKMPTTISRAENEMETHQSKITQAVMEREYLKVQLRAISRLIKKGYAKKFEKFEEKELREKVLNSIEKSK